MGKQKNTERELLETVLKYAESLNKIKPDNKGNYNILDLLNAPFSEEYKSILRKNHSDEWIKNLENHVKERKGRGKMEESILKEAEEIVNGERASDYGSAKESFGKIATLSSLMLNKKEKESLFLDATLTDTIVCKVLIAVKLTRESYKHKRDNLVDLCGYTELLNRLEEK
jgi:hypothetical protein